MKKIKLLGTVLLLSVVTTLLVACQKEQDGVTNEIENNSVTEGGIAVEIDATQIPGNISQDEAASMATRYKNARLNKSEYIGFKVKDIENYLKVLKKSKSENVYVNFGMYSNGRLTVFFSGDKKTSTGSKKNDEDEGGRTDFLNHGGIYP